MEGRHRKRQHKIDLGWWQICALGLKVLVRFWVINYLEERLARKTWSGNTMQGRSHLGQYLEWAVKMAAWKGKKMLKTLRRQNQAFRSHKKPVFMLSLYLLQYPWACLLMQSLITWSGRAFFLLLTSGYPVPHDPCWAEQCLWPGAYFTSLYHEWQSPVLNSPAGSFRLPSHILHVHLGHGPPAYSILTFY